MEKRILRLLQIAFYLTGSLASGLVVWQAIMRGEIPYDPRPLQNLLRLFQSFLADKGLVGVLFLIACIAALVVLFVTFIAVGRAIAQGNALPVRDAMDSRIFQIGFSTIFLVFFAAILVRAIEIVIRVVSTFR